MTQLRHTIQVAISVAALSLLSAANPIGVASAEPSPMSVSLLDRVNTTGVTVDGQVYVPADAVQTTFDLQLEQTPDRLRLVNILSNPLVLTGHDPQGPWLAAEHSSVEEWGDVRMVDGLPKFVYRGGEYWLPVTIAHYGLQQYSKWRTGSAEGWANAVRAADWFAANQDAAGGWPAMFDYDPGWPGGVGMLRSGWYSAMSQGMAADLLAKIYVQTGQSRYRIPSERALLLLEVPVDNGGLQRRFDGQVWWEEYPTRPASYVLNGFLYTLVSVYDVAVLMSDDRAERLYPAGLGALQRMVNLYDLGNRTSYDLLHYSVPGTPPNIARWDYHNLHVTLLSALNAITGGRFTDVQARWLGYVTGVSSPHN